MSLFASVASRYANRSTSRRASRLTKPTLAQPARPSHDHRSSPTAVHPHPSTDALPDHYLRQQALSAARQGRYTEALQRFTQLIERHPDQATDYNNRGLVYFQSGQPEQAIADYNQALALNPRLAHVYNNRANYYISQGQFAQAMSDYEQALDLDPTNLRVWLNRGITLRDLGLGDRALESFDLGWRWLQKTLVLAPSPSNQELAGHLLAERGHTHHLNGDWNAAIQDYHQALDYLNPQLQPTSRASQELYHRIQRWLTSLLQINPNQVLEEF